MVQIPYSLIDNNTLDIYERAIIPLIIRHTIGWDVKGVGIEASTLAYLLNIEVKTVVDVLDSLQNKGIVEVLHVKNRGEDKKILYTLSKRIKSLEKSETFNTTNQIVTRENPTSNYFLDLTNEGYNELKSYALKLIAQLKLSEDVFIDFELYQRGKNTKSFDWKAEFQRWALREQKKLQTSKAVVQHDSSFKPTPEQFQLTQYFISKLQSIDPQFIEPTDWSWAQEIKTLIEIEGYSSEDIKNVIDWLFSAKGDWYRPNVTDAFKLHEKFSYLVSHIRSYRDSKYQLPEGVNIFDVIEKS